MQPWKKDRSKGF